MDKSNKGKLIRSIVIVVASIVYIISPIDIIPDSFLGFGQMDDLGILVLAIVEASNAWRIIRDHRAAKSQAQDVKEEDAKLAENNEPFEGSEN